MNEDLARALDDLLSWLDTRYQPDIKRTLTPRQYHSAWEIDKIQFRTKVLDVLEVRIESIPADLRARILNTETINESGVLICQHGRPKSICGECFPNG